MYIHTVYPRTFTFVPSFQLSQTIPSHRLVFPPRLSTELEDFAHLHQPQEELAKLPGDGDELEMVGGWGMEVG